MVGFGVELREGEVDDGFDLSILVVLLELCPRCREVQLSGISLKGLV